MAIEGGRIHIDYDGRLWLNHAMTVAVLAWRLPQMLLNFRLLITGRRPPQLMAEPYIPGLELTVSVLDGEPLTVTEITQSRDFYDYQAKYEVGGSRHHLPARGRQNDF